MRKISYKYNAVPKKSLTWISLLVLGLSMVAGITGAINLKATDVNALSGSQFQAGNIIDDGVFYEGYAMSSQDVQRFLDSKVPTCDTNGSKVYSGSTTRAQYGAANGNPAPYTCLKDFSQNTPSMPGETGLCTGLSGGIRSAAQIIRDVGVVCGINPQVLLVLLQKEQSLITDEWPWQKQYDKATGFGCPDTAPCNPSYGGFFYQVYYGARAFKKYARDANQYNYFAKSNNSIRYNPVVSCGNSNVYIQNQATASLYIYTPYQPNAAALNNLYGTGDNCSAYGNRNFWRMFNDWFGTTYANIFKATLDSRSYAAETSPGQAKQVTLRFRNSGQWAWHDSAVNWPGIPAMQLRTANGNGLSIFSYGWQSQSVVSTTFSKVYEGDGTTLASNQHIANSGQIVEFTFNVTAPWSMQSGVYPEFFRVSMDGVDLGPGSSTGLNAVVPPLFNGTSLDYQTTTILPGQAKQVTLRFRNSGQWAWHDSAVNWPGIPAMQLRTANGNGLSIFSYGWQSQSVVSTTFSKVYEGDGTTLASNQHIANSGQIVEFTFNVTAPWSLSIGDHAELFRLKMQGSDMDMGINSSTFVRISAPIWGASLDTQTPSTTLHPGESKQVTLRFRNSGQWTWHDSTVNWPGVPALQLKTANSNGLSVFAYGWPSQSLVANNFSKVYEANGTTLASNQHIANSGQIVEFTFNVTAPWSMQSGVYPEFFRVSMDGVDLGPGSGAAIPITVER